MMTVRKTLILTSSYDATTDLLVRHIGSANTFRFNYDLWRDYEILWSPDSLTIRTEACSVDVEQIVKCYWRKPFAPEFEADPALASYLRGEIRYLFRELFSLFHRRGLAILVDPFSENRLGKLGQASVASTFFAVPWWNFSFGPNSRNVGRVVAKSLASTPLADGRRFYAHEVDGAHLDSGHPWYLQTAVDADSDLTVVYVDGDCYGFSLKRGASSPTDWRVEPANHNTEAWSPYTLGEEQMVGIRGFMQACDLRFGRLDFLVKGEELVFLEVNTNGQWAWLDLNGERGLLARMVDEVSPLSNRFTRC